MATAITGLTQSTFEKIQMDAGVLLKNFDRASITTKEALAAAIASARGTEAWIGATVGGGSFSATPTTREIEVDGMRSAFVGSTLNDGWEVKLSATLAEFTPENIKMALGAADATKNEKVTVIDLRTDFAESDYIETITWIGKLTNGSFAMIEIENGLAVGGFNFTFADKANGTIPIEITAHQASVENQDKVPCHIVFFE